MLHMRKEVFSKGKYVQKEVTMKGKLNQKARLGGKRRRKKDMHEGNAYGKESLKWRYNIWGKAFTKEKYVEMRSKEGEGHEKCIHARKICIEALAKQETRKNRCTKAL